MIFMVPPAGFKPTTPWFEARYSIQLSYGGSDVNYRVIPSL